MSVMKQSYRKIYFTQEIEKYNCYRSESDKTLNPSIGFTIFALSPSKKKWVEGLTLIGRIQTLLSTVLARGNAQLSGLINNAYEAV